jgi:hypothetical protein
VNTIFPFIIVQAACATIAKPTLEAGAREEKFQ